MNDETIPERDLDPTAARAKMVAALRRRGIADERVLGAMGMVERHRYVLGQYRDLAYHDRPLAIGSQQTISQPYMVALMAQEAEITSTDRVLEVGTGSGYGAAVLGALAEEVWTVERVDALADQARSRLRRDGFDSVNVIIGDGAQGWRPAAPYQAILVTASPRALPMTLTEQLDEGGRLIVPIGPRRKIQTLTRVRRHNGTLLSEELGPVRFVPLL